MEIVWFTAMSMDGRIASADHSLDFLDSISGPGGNDFDEFIAGVDGILLGAETLRWLVRHGHGWPHDDLPTWLVSHDEELAESVRPTRAPLVRVAGDLMGPIETMERSGRRRVWLAGGGSVAAQVLAHDRLDEVIATIAPTALGSGPALFDGSGLPPRTFELIECRSTGSAARLHWVRGSKRAPA
jgi:riboflavin biosynthesis pyrimidine reductase